MRKLIFVFALFLVAQTFLLAQNGASTLSQASPAEAGMSADHLALLDQHIEKFVAEGHVPGGVFMITRKGKMIYNKSFGHRASDKKEPYQTDDIFRLASMTKAFTTVSVMQLYERGQLGLDDPIFYYIPAFAKPVVLDEYNAADTSFTSIPAKRAITIRHLLTHTSGITYGGFNPGKIQAIYTKMGATNFGLSHDKATTEEMANQIAKVPLIFQPGEQYKYGLNMEILGRIVEVVSGKPLNQYFKENIFDPLGMKDTYFYLPATKHDRLVPIYTYGEDQKLITVANTPMAQVMDYPKREDNNHYAGGGGTSGTAMDYAKFTQALVNGGTFNGHRILSRKSIEVMTSDQLTLVNQEGKGFSKTPGITYGLGFALKTEAGQASSHKSPGTYEWGGYFNTKFFIDPQEELTFVGMTQIVPFRRNDFWNKMYAIIYGAIED